MIDLWTDGSAKPNPGAGGWAVIDGESGEPVAIGRRDETTNIRMEASALYAAMKYAKSKGEKCVIHTDSKFWIDVLTKWAAGWEKRGWRKADNKEPENVEVVKSVYGIYDPNMVQLVWTKGHAGTKYNELADIWANKAREGEKL